MNDKHKVLDHGYVQLVDVWGSDARVIEAARMSTNKGFTQWEDRYECSVGGGGAHVNARAVDPQMSGPEISFACAVCKAPLRVVKGDVNLLRYLYEHKHMTPFEMCGMTIEVKAPIFVFREWHRHRTQGYNEMSARYVPLPDENYAPDLDNVMERMSMALMSNNRQAASMLAKDAAEREDVVAWLTCLGSFYRDAQSLYQSGLQLGVPKELARLCVPVARYSRMRATANLRNWLGFLALRLDEGAQWEIRQYAGAVGGLIERVFPRTWALFKGEKNDE